MREVRSIQPTALEGHMREVDKRKATFSVVRRQERPVAETRRPSSHGLGILRRLLWNAV